MMYNSGGSFNSHYVYDAETNHYKRYSANVETIDAETNESIELVNVLFLKCPTVLSIVKVDVILRLQMAAMRT